MIRITHEQPLPRPVCLKALTTKKGHLQNVEILRSDYCEQAQGRIVDYGLFSAKIVSVRLALANHSVPFRAAL